MSPTAFDESFNALSAGDKSTKYTAIAQQGPIEGFAEHSDAPRPPFPPFDADTALQKVKAAEDGWNSRDPEKVCLAYTPDTVWRNRGEIFTGREQVKKFLTGKWEKELDYKLVKNLWDYNGNRIAVRFTYEFRDATSGQWYRCHGNELWEFDDKGLMKHRDMSGNNIPIAESDRLFK